MSISVYLNVVLSLVIGRTSGHSPCRAVAGCSIAPDIQATELQPFQVKDIIQSPLYEFDWKTDRDPVPESATQSPVSGSAYYAEGPDISKAGTLNAYWPPGYQMSSGYEPTVLQDPGHVKVFKISSAPVSTTGYAPNINRFNDYSGNNGGVPLVSPNYGFQSAPDYKNTVKVAFALQPPPSLEVNRVSYDEEANNTRSPPPNPIKLKDAESIQLPHYSAPTESTGSSAYPGASRIEYAKIDPLALWKSLTSDPTLKYLYVPPLFTGEQDSKYPETESSQSRQSESDAEDRPVFNSSPTEKTEAAGPPALDAFKNPPPTADFLPNGETSSTKLPGLYSGEPAESLQRYSDDPRTENGFPVDPVRSNPNPSEAESPEKKYRPYFNGFDKVFNRNELESPYQPVQNYAVQFAPFSNEFNANEPSNETQQAPSASTPENFYSTLLNYFKDDKLPDKLFPSNTSYVIKQNKSVTPNAEKEYAPNNVTVPMAFTSANAPENNYRPNEVVAQWNRFDSNNVPVVACSPRKEYQWIYPSTYSNCPESYSPPPVKKYYIASTPAVRKYICKMTIYCDPKYLQQPQAPMANSGRPQGQRDMPILVVDSEETPYSTNDRLSLFNRFSTTPLQAKGPQSDEPYNSKYEEVLYGQPKKQTRRLYKGFIAEPIFIEPGRIYGYQTRPVYSGDDVGAFSFQVPVKPPLTYLEVNKSPYGVKPVLHVNTIEPAVSKEMASNNNIRPYLVANYVLSNLLQQSTAPYRYVEQTPNADRTFRGKRSSDTTLGVNAEEPSDRKKRSSDESSKSRTRRQLRNPMKCECKSQQPSYCMACQVASIPNQYKYKYSCAPVPSVAQNSFYPYPSAGNGQVQPGQDYTAQQSVQAPGSQFSYDCMRLIASSAGLTNSYGQRLKRSTTDDEENELEEKIPQLSLRRTSPSKFEEVDNSTDKS